MSMQGMMKPSAARRNAECTSQGYSTDTGRIGSMNAPFPGMDPYLEHPVLWESVHARLIMLLADQLQPRLDPRYVASIEERVFVEGPQRRIPDIWVQKARESSGAVAVAERKANAAVVLEVDDLEVRQ